MPLAEFSLIEKYFAAAAQQRADVSVDIGDDAAVVDVPAGEQLVAAVDTLVAGVHFPDTASAYDIGHKALAVNLSDIAAMGACPRWATLALTLPQIDEVWVAAFARGFLDLALRYQVALIGGDTTRGGLTISVQILGSVAAGKALLRSGARAGDLIFVSGTLGDAGLALRLLSRPLVCAADTRAALDARLHQPEPRVLLGMHLRDIASAAIDVSDGLLADLGHILERSGVGATVWVDRLPRSSAFKNCMPEHAADWYELPLSAGDDYELCFTVAPEQLAALHVCASELAMPITEIGVIEATLGLRCSHDDARPYVPQRHGYEHFIQSEPS